MMVMGGVWVLAWLLLGATGLAPAGLGATLGVLAFHAVFAFGETMLQPTVPAMTNDLAPDHLRGRYNAINAAAFQGGTIVGPVVAGLMLQHHLGGVFVAVMVVGSGAIGVMALALERRVSAEANGVGSPVGTAAPV
jgi:MFS family permease